jgi:hypothetical protein
MNTSLRSCICVTLAMLAIALAAFPAAAQDIQCMCTKRTFDRPGNCTRECRGGLGCPVKCAISPRCAGFDDTPFRQFYNRAVFGIGGGMGGPNANDVVVAHIINLWFKPNNIRDFNVSWGRPENTDDWAHVMPPSSGAQKLALVVSPDAIWLSPAGLVSALGHEMIHVEQMKRSYSVRMTGINSALTSFRELEASSWEGGASDFRWAIGPSKWSSCLPADEKQASDNLRACRDWQALKAIENIRTSLRGAQFVSDLQKYMSEDPWISQVWMKKYPDWKTRAAGPAPTDCPSP